MEKKKAVTKTNLPSIEALFEAKSHLGHQARRWSPKMAPYIFSKVGSGHIIDLDQTLLHLKAAVDFLSRIKDAPGKILFVGTKRQAKDLIGKIAEETGGVYVKERWVGGILTNFEGLHRNVTRLSDTNAKLAGGGYNELTKKERLLIKRRAGRTERLLGGLLTLDCLPKAAIIVDPRREKVALAECLRVKVPVVAIVDTNTNPDGIAYPIPANDDAISSLELILGTLAKALR